MRRQITHVSIHQTSKVVSLCYFSVCLFAIPVGLVMIVAVPQARGMGVFMLFAPIVYGVGGYLMLALSGVIYNFIAARVGGVEFDSVDTPGAV